MDTQFEFVLIGIEWSLNYSFAKDPLLCVCEIDNSKTVDDLILDKDGVPISGHDAEKIRRNIIFEHIKKWHENHPESKIFNSDLDEFIIINHSFMDEATAHSAKSYVSTKAVLNFEQIIKEARKYAVTKTKVGTKNQSKFQEMLVLTNQREDLGTVKLTVGVRFKSHAKIQYGMSVPPQGQPLVDTKSLNTKKKESKNKKHLRK
ncbi:MAG: hypothetical protein KBT39_08365 [Bacteroidales bacterium]|nr:hypothetical protein [Bacteroidales bacterium]